MSIFEDTVSFVFDNNYPRNLSKCSKLSDSPFQAFFRAVTRLTDLNISSCNALTTNVFSGLLPAVNTNLATLDFGNSVAVQVE